MTIKAKEIIEKELKEKTGKLYLSFCELDRIPEEVGKRIWLTVLDLSGNKKARQDAWKA